MPWFNIEQRKEAPGFFSFPFLADQYFIAVWFFIACLPAGRGTTTTTKSPDLADLRMCNGFSQSLSTRERPRGV